MSDRVAQCRLCQSCERRCSRLPFSLKADDLTPEPRAACQAVARSDPLFLFQAIDDQAQGVETVA
jgi:hypothetical protein